MKQFETWKHSVLATGSRVLTSLPLIVLVAACAGDTLPLDDPDDGTNTTDEDGGEQGSDGQGSDGQGSDGQGSDGQSSSAGTSGSTATGASPKGGGLKDLRMTTFMGEPYGALGLAASIVGNLDGDEYADLVLLDYGGSGPSPSLAFDTRGAAYLFYGRPSF